MAANPNQQEFNLREYWQILVRRRWLIYTSVLVATVAAVVASFIATPIYRATCTVSIERSGVRLLKQDLGSSEPSWLDYQNFYNTQYRIIESDRVLKEAVDILNLPVRGLPGEKSKLAATLSEFRSDLAAQNAGEDQELREYIKFLRGGLSVDPVRDSHLVEISFVSPDKDFAAEASNAVAEAYKKFTLGAKLEIAEQSQEFFIERIDDLRKQILLEDAHLQQIARKHQLVSGDSNEAALKNFDDLRERLTKTQADLAEASGRYRAYEQAPASSLEEVRTNTLVQQLAASVSEAEREYSEKLATYGAQYPEVVKARAKLEDARARLKSETETIARQVVDAARVEYLTLKNQVDELNRQFESSRRVVDEFQGPYAEYMTQKKVVEAKRTTLNDLLDKQNQMALSASLGETGHNVRVIDAAQPPEFRFKPKRKLNVMLGFLFGLFLGVGGAVLMEYIDNTIKTPEDVRQVINLPLLGMIPEQALPARERRAALARRMRPPEEQGESSDLDPALITLQSPLSPVAEAYRELRTAILLATPGHPPRDLAVTSCQPGEGKTTTAINLAIALAQLGRRVLVVDTDLRRPRCHQVLRVSSARGVSTYLTGNSDFGELIIPTAAERVSVIPAGPIPPNPAELLDAERFRELVAALRGSGEFEHVIFDSPPVLSVVDPLVIGRQLDGTVLVIKAAHTSRDSGRLGKDKLISGRVPILGVLLNAVPTEHVPHQYRYYRYGYSRREKERDKEARAGERGDAASGSGRGRARSA